MKPSVGWNRHWEVLVLFGLLPLVPLSGLLPRPWFIWLYLLSIPTMVWLRREGVGLWVPTDVKIERAVLRRVIVRFGVSASLLTLATWWFLPDEFLRFPSERPLMWAAVMLLYPLAAVYPQELIFRAFFLRRYASLFPSILYAVAMSAIVFGWAHVGFGSPVSIFLSTVGGVMFASTYRASGSLRLACLEHALYGDLIFSVGLGAYFYSGWFPT